MQPETSDAISMKCHSAMSAIRSKFPDLDEDMGSYIEEILFENYEHFESADELNEAIGSFLMTADANSSPEEIEVFCGSLYKMLSLGFFNMNTIVLDEPVHLANLVENFNERVINDSSIWMAKRESSNVVDKKRLAKADAKLKEKLLKKGNQPMNGAIKPVSSDQESACVNQVTGKRDKQTVSNDGSFRRITDIHLENFDLSYGNRVLLENAVLHISWGRRYGLIGRNGYGKTTLLRSLARGDLRLPAGVTVLHVEQEVTADSTLAIESVISADTERTNLLKEVERLKGLKDENSEKCLLGQIYDRLVAIDADKAASRAASILHGLGFSTESQNRPTKEFSGGWRMRLALARALFARPDLLLLDEPTNMLDMRAMFWLEAYLQTWIGMMIVVSHDQAFLNNISTDILHLSAKRLDAYRGDYDTFERAREERLLNQEREYLSQKAEREHIQKFIDTFRFNAKRASLVQSRIKMLERMPKLILPDRPTKVIFALPQCDSILQPLVELDEVYFQYTLDTPLLDNVSLSISGNSRICIVGENGAGKSTLLRLLLGELSPTKGSRHAHKSLRFGYFSQHHVDQLDLNINSLQFLMKKFPNMTEQVYRSQLAAFDIKELLAQQPIGTLSGGQKSRVAFAALCMSKPNLLILDEPTNHLDIETISALSEALKTFNGGVVLVSHDERLIHTVCNQLWVCSRHHEIGVHSNAENRISKVVVLAGGLSQYKDIVNKEMTDPKRG